MNNNDMNVIEVTEDRSFVDKARKAYKEKIVDTGKSQELEKQIEASAERKKKIIKIAGTIATIALIICPADGPFGELCTLLATPALCALVDVSADIKKKALISGKRAGEKYIMHVDGSNSEVSAYDLENGEAVNDFKKLKKSMDDFQGGLSR